MKYVITIIIGLLIILSEILILKDKCRVNTPLFNNLKKLIKIVLLIIGIYLIGMFVINLFMIDIKDNIFKIVMVGLLVFPLELINLRKSFDDYEKVLKKTKDCKITKLILEHNQKFDIDLLPYYQKNISIDVLTFISSCLLKKENMTPYKKIFNLSKESFPLYKKIYENVKDFNKYKNLGMNALKLINEAIDSNLEGKFGKIDIDKCIESYNNFNFYDPLKFMFICYKYKQEKLIEDLNPLMKDFYAFRMNEENLEKLIKYNYENENKIDIPSVIYNFESLDIETKEIIDLYTLYITKNIATQEIIDKLKPLNFNSNETKIILNAYNEGYDIDVMLNPNLRVVDLDAIYKCMVMGFKLEKDTELNLTKKEKRSPETSRKRTLYSYYDDNCEYFEIR